MGKPKKVEPIQKQKNPFAVLADSDDDSLPDYAPISPPPEERPEVDVEADVEAHSEEEGRGSVEELTKDSFRIWKTDDDAKRFFSDTNNIFSSPFSHKKGLKKREDDGWVSIQMGENVDSNVQTFPSMLTRGKSDEENALAWAEKIKETLEKAGNKKERLSFFRRSNN